MADIQDTDLFLVNRNNTTSTLPASDLMAEILDDDLMLVNRGGQTYKVTGAEVKDSLGPSESPPSMTGATLAGSGPGFSGETYTTTLLDYFPGEPEADQTMKAKVTGALLLEGETSPITGVVTAIATSFDCKGSNPQNFGTGWIDLNANNISWDSLTSDRGTDIPIGDNITNGGSDQVRLFRSNTPSDIPGLLLGLAGYSGSTVQHEVWSSPDGTAGSWTSLGQKTNDEIGAGVLVPGEYGALTIKDSYMTVDTYTCIGSEELTTLSLTDRKDLDNGLFLPGDVVQIDVTQVPADPPRSSDYTLSFSGSAQGVDFDPVFDGNIDTFGSWKPRVDTSTYQVKFSFEQLEYIGTEGKLWFRPVSTITSVDVTFNGGIKVRMQSTTERPAGSSEDGWYVIAREDVPADATVMYEITIDLLTNSSDTFYVGSFVIGDRVVSETAYVSTEVSIVGIDPVDSKMAVNGGTWNVGETVKNTVARAPVVTPETDEIVGYDEATTTLTFAGDKDLALLKAGDDIVQDSGGYIPESAPIIGVGAPVLIDVVDRASINTGGLTPTGSAADLFSPSGSWGIPRWSGSRSGDMTIAWDGGLIPANQIRVTASHSSNFTATLSVYFTDGTGDSGVISSIQNSDVTIDCEGKIPSSIVYSWKAQSDCSVVVNGVFLDGNRVEATINAGQDLFLQTNKDLENFREGDVVQKLLSESPVYFAVNDPDGPPGVGSSFTIYDTCSIDMTSTAAQSVGVDENRPGGYTLKSLIFDLLINEGDITVGAGTTGWTVASSIDGVTWVSEGVIDPGAGTSMRATMVNQPTARYIALGAATMSNNWNGVDAFTVAMNQAIVDVWASGEYPATDLPTTQDIKVTGINTQTNVMGVTGGTWTNGMVVTGPTTTPGTGTVDSADPVAKTITLSAVDETFPKRWISNGGKFAIGPTGPATRVDAYLTWSGNQVTGIKSGDPGYFQAPPNLELTFTDPSPTGQTWDQELPAGTTIATRVQATNASGSADSGWSNTVTPRFLRPGDALPETFAETTLRMATFDNRAAVYQGEQAMAKREALAKQLEAQGVDAAELLGVKAKAKRSRKKD